MPPLNNPHILFMIILLISLRKEQYKNMLSSLHYKDQLTYIHNHTVFPSIPSCSLDPTHFLYPHLKDTAFSTVSIFSTYRIIPMGTQTRSSISYLTYSSLTKSFQAGFHSDFIKITLHKVTSILLLTRTSGLILYSPF